MTPADSILFASSILVASLIGYLAADLLCPVAYPRWLVWAFAPLTGVGICSIIVFFFRRPMLTVEIMLLSVLLFFWFRSHGVPLHAWRSLISWRVPLFSVIFAIVLSWFISSSVGYVARRPHGLTDGWAIWNSHARYMFSGGSTWRQDLVVNTYHPDYPLLLPGVIVHAWRYIGDDVPDIPGFVGIGFVLAAIVVLVGTLVKLRKPSIALLMGFALIGSPGYVHYAVAEYADVPLSAFMLGTIALICLYEEETSNPMGLMALAGFMAGCAAWTKNEGLPFILVTSSVLLLPIFWKPTMTLRRITAFAAGAALPLAAIVHFKMTAPANDIMSSLNYVEVAAKILNPERHAQILENLRTTGWTFGGWLFNPYIPILAFVALGGADRLMIRSFGWRSGVAILLMVLATYYAIYVITPLDLHYHLVSSLDRLLLHVWPLCLLLAGMSARLVIPSGGAR